MVGFKGFRPLVGGRRGVAPGPDCSPTGGEYLYNFTFDCGVDGWGFDVTYPATITDNGDGSVHLKSEGDYSSLVPDDIPTEDASWIIEVKVRNQVGVNPGKISIRDTGGTWDSVSFVDMADGTQTNEYTGVISALNIGADNDATYEADFDYISLKKA